jgi:3-oxoacyl-[acyl-carrier protein] reductase
LPGFLQIIRRLGNCVISNRTTSFPCFGFSEFPFSEFQETNVECLDTTLFCFIPGKGAVEKTVATFGRLDILVNNAGTAIPKTFEETTLEEMDRLLDINVRGGFIARQAALKHMKSGSRIIMIGSAVGERVVVPGLVPYAATKGAVKIFTQALARELGSRGMTVNNVQPGPIDTELNPAASEWAVPQKAATALDRYGHVDEIAAMVAFVAGPESSYITGANLTVDGGMNA